MASCDILTHKGAGANSRSTLVSKGIVGELGNKILTVLSVFDREVVRQSQHALTSYGVKETLYTREKRGDEWYAVPNYDAFKKIDDKRKEFGIYDTKEAVNVYYERKKKEYEAAVDELYKQRDEDVAPSMSPEGVDTGYGRHIKSTYFADSNTQKASTILSKIANSGHPLAPLARHLQNYAFLNDVNIVLKNTTGFKDVTPEVRMSTGVYRSKSNTIEMAQLVGRDPQRVETVLLHEILHALSWWALRNDTIASRKFNEYYKQSVEALGKFDPDSQESYYANYTMDEFFVGLFTDSRFIKALSSIPAKSSGFKNKFEEIMNFLLNLLKIRKGSTLYTESMSIASNILEDAVQSLADRRSLFEQQAAYEDSASVAPSIIENEMPESYWKEVYNNPKLVNTSDFKSIDIPGVKNKFQPDTTHVYHGTNTYKLDDEGNLILVPSQNFNDKTTSISMTQVPVVAQDYMLRKNGNFIIKISNEALGDRYTIESAEEIAVNGNAPLIVPKGQYTIIPMPSLADSMKRKYQEEVSYRADKMIEQAQSDIDLLDSIYYTQVRAENYSELMEYQNDFARELAPDWYVAEEYLDSRAGKEVFKRIKDRLSKESVINGLANKILEATKNYGETVEVTETFLLQLSTYGGYGSPSWGNLFDFLLADLGATEADREDIIKQIQETVAKGERAALEFYNSAEQQALREEQERRFMGGVKDDLPFQLESMPMSVANKELTERVKEVLKRMGVSIEDLAAYARKTGLDARNVNAVADLTRRVIAIAEGKEGAAITEEMVHIATAIIEQVNPKMMTEMMSRITRFSIYQKTLKAYGGNKAYQLPDGRPDIRKIKKEAVDKLLAEIIVNNGENIEQFPELREEIDRSLIRKWWEAILDFFRGSYRKSNIQLFKEVASSIMDNKMDYSTVPIKGVFYQLSTKQQDLVNKFKQTHDSINKVYREAAAEEVLQDSEEANNWYERVVDGVSARIANRVTDRVKKWYKKKFPNKSFTEAEKKANEVKRTEGIKGHADFENIIKRYFNSDGTRKSEPDARPAQFNVASLEMYEALERYVVELVDSLSHKADGTPTNLAVLTEVVVYDPTKDEAGTIDVLMIEEDGTVHIFDWKFMQLSEASNDIPLYKQGAYEIQLGRYKDILKEQYGVTKFGKTRAVPILMQLSYKDRDNHAKGLYMSGFSIGSADPKTMEPLKLTPYSVSTESTGDAMLDKVVKNLVVVLGAVKKEEATTEEEQNIKQDRIDALHEAIRYIQAYQNLNYLIDTLSANLLQGQSIANRYNMIKDLPASSDQLENQFLSDLSYDIKVFLASSALFSHVDETIDHLIYDPNTDVPDGTEEKDEDIKYRKDILARLTSIAKATRKMSTEVTAIRNAFGNKFIGERNLVVGLDKPEAVIKGLSANFEGAEQLGSAAITTMTKMTADAQIKAKASALEKIKRLMDLRGRILKKHPSIKGYIQQIFQYTDKGEFMNKLIQQYKQEFYDKISQFGLTGGEKKWIEENVDIEAYKADAKEVMEKRLKRIEENPYYQPLRDDDDATLKDKAEKKAKAILRIVRELDITRADFNGWGNYILKKHPLPKWFTKEYKEIHDENGEALELYNLIRELNTYAKDAGYIHAMVEKTFMPFVRKSFAENFKLSGSITAINNFFASLQARADDIGYGSINELSQELENSLPRYYTKDFTVGEGSINDYSEVSDEVFKNLILYIQQVEKYKYLSEIEDQLLLVKDIEQTKKHLVTTRTGAVVRDENGNPKVQDTNEENTKMFTDFLNSIFYGQKYSVSDADTPVHADKAVNFVKRAINKLARRQVFDMSKPETYTSMTKVLEAVNKGVSLKVLGLEPFAGAVNFFGANLQVMAQAGNYFKAGEFTKNEWTLRKQLLGFEGSKVFMGLLDAFMPMNEDPAYELYKEAGLTKLTRRSLTDDMMVFMRKPEQLVEKAIFKSLLDNMMVEDGKIVSIPAFVKNKYRTVRYARPEEVAKYEKIIQEEIATLQKEKSITATAKIENDKLVVPGLDLTNLQELKRITQLTRRISDRATGKISETNKNKMSMNVWTNSMMVFKNWIAPLALTRFQELKKISDDFSTVIKHEDGETVVEGEKYDIGRVRLYMYVLGTSIRERSTNIVNILRANEQGLKKLDELFVEYAKSYEERTGQKFTMTKEDFMDMIRTNLLNQTRELRLLLALLAMSLSLGFMAPDDDEDKATKNAFRYTQRLLDKYVDEVAFFYKPDSIANILSSGMPAVSLFTDSWKFVSHFIMQVTGFDLSDPTQTMEEVRKKAMPIKYLAKMAPVTRSLVTYAAMFSSDFAKEFDITVQKESGRNR